MKKYQFITVLIIVLFIIGFLFYWYEWRPSNIRKECTDYAKEADARFIMVDYDTTYEKCLTEHGLVE